VVVEVQAGRGARGIVVYRDVVRTSLLVGAWFFALGGDVRLLPSERRTTISVVSYRLRTVKAATPLHIEEVRTLLFEPLSDEQVEALAEIGRELRRTLDPRR